MRLDSLRFRAATSILHRREIMFARLQARRERPALEFLVATRYLKIGARWMTDPCQFDILQIQ